MSSNFSTLTVRTLLLAPLLLASACTALGPDFVQPEAPRLADWTQEEGDVLSTATPEAAAWWTVFNDPVLDTLVTTAYRQNLSLQIAGLRIMEARAQLGIATGRVYPQLQQLSGSALQARLSENSPNFNPLIDKTFHDYQLGFDAAWEIDFWGRFRRGIETADANLAVSIADYDNALVTLIAEVARSYVTIRTLEERLLIARANIKLQEESLRIATVRYRNGATTDLDVQQAKSNLSDTQSQVPALERSLRQAKNALSTLLGMPPSELADLLGTDGSIPEAPASVAIGIPAELLRRRPDVQQAEMLAAGQSAQIGVAETELYPKFSLLGSIGYASSNTAGSSAGDLFNSDSLTFVAGPTFRWNILNYGRLKNNVRVQDARYQQTIVNYRDTVLTAYREVEDAMVGFIQSQREAGFLDAGARASRRSTEIANIQYREGAVDFQRVIDSERALVVQQDRWINSRGDIALYLIDMYKALGGGWEVRAGHDFISEENRQQMEQRTDWGDLLTTGSKSE
jgi:NodT family efflux transporter outer membrane factor (OMF) lipoprotein